MTEHVKIYGVKPRIQYVADGSLTTYDFPFATFSASDIEVYLQDVKQASNTYTVQDAGSSDGGSVVFNSAPTSGTIITIVRNLSIERTSDFQEGSALRAKVLNDELDYQIACQQQIADNLNRSMVLPPYATDNDLDLTLPVPSAGKAIVWNSDGTNLENSTVEVNAMESTLKGYKETAESAASTATIKAGIASDKADIASAKAEIATEKAAEAATILTNKANKDMDNLTGTGKQTVIHLLMPDYSTGVSRTDNTEYTATEDGWLEFYIVPYNTSSIASLTINSTQRTVGIASSGHFNCNYCIVPIAKGDIYKVQFSRTDASQYINFYPCLGA